MNADPRHAAAAATLLIPDSISVGPYTVRKFSGGDMLAAQAIGLTIASEDEERVTRMTNADKTRELLTVGALLCHPRATIQALVFEGKALPASFAADVVFSLSAEETSRLLVWVVQFFVKAKALDFAVEAKPSENAEKEEPKGNE